MTSCTRRHNTRRRSYGAPSRRRTSHESAATRCGRFPYSKKWQMRC